MICCPQCMRQVPEGTFCTQCGADLSYQALVHQLPAGTILTDGAFRSYEIGAVKGQGGFGITYIAQDLRRKIRVAIKEYYPMQCAQRNGICVEPQPGCEAVFAGGQSNFLMEAKMLATLPALESVVQIMDYFEVNGTAYIVMEYLDGVPLYQLVMKDGSITPQNLFPRLPKLMQDLKILHDAGIIHRDISPDNIMWMPNGSLKLLDFGSARHLEDGKSVSIQLKHGFAPVEQYRTKGQGPYTDVYALCATIYYCITGQVPPHPVERLENDQLKAPSTLGIPMERSWEEALLWGLTVQPKSRPQETEVLLQRMFPGRREEPEPKKDVWDDKPDIKQDDPDIQGDDNHSKKNKIVLSGSDSPVKQKKTVPTTVIIAVAAAAAAIILLIVLVGMLLRDRNEPEFDEPAEDLRELPTVEQLPAEETAEDEIFYEEVPEDLVTEDGYHYELVNGKAFITGHEGGQRMLSVPETIEDLPVTRICSGAFRDSDVIQLFLPDTVEMVEEDALTGCRELEQICIYGRYRTIFFRDSLKDCDRLRIILLDEGSDLEGAVPDRVLVFSNYAQTRFGAVCDYVLHTNGVILGITDTEQYVLLKVPMGMEELDLYALYEEETPVAYIYPGVLEAAPDLMSLSLCGDTVIEWDDMDGFDGDLYYYDGRLSGSWVHGLYLADYLRSFGQETTVDLALTRTALDFVKQYYVANMDENFWIDLMYEAGISYSSGKAVKMACSEEDMVDVLCDQIDAIYENGSYSHFAVAYSWSSEEGVEFLLICYNP